MGLLRFIFRLPFLFVKYFCVLCLLITKSIGRVLSPIIGKINWKAPKWTPFVTGLFYKSEAFVAKHTGKLAIITLILAAMVSGGYYSYHAYLNRPKPVEIAPMVYHDLSMRVYGPSKTDYSKKPFDIYPLAIEFSSSAAPIDNINKAVTEGITLSPSIEGEWHWQDDSTLIFTPKNDWSIGQTYKIDIDAQKLLAEQNRLEKTSAEFTTRKFNMEIQSVEFYQNPQDGKQKNAIFHVYFSHPVDVKSFEKALSMNLLTPLTKGSKKYHSTSYQYAIQYNKDKLDAWIRSEPVQLPSEDSRMVLTIAEGVESTLKGNKTGRTIKDDVYVPNQYRDLIQRSQVEIVDISDNKQQQVLIVDLVDEISLPALKKEVKAWILPSYYPKTAEHDAIQNYWWSDRNDISAEILKLSREIPLTFDDLEDDIGSIASFKFNAEPYQYIYVQIGTHLESVGGYKPRHVYHKVLEVPDYPQSLKFMSEGSLLSLKGERKIPIIARNIPGVQFDIKRIIPSQLQHLVSFNRSGEFAKMDFDRVDESYFTEHFVNQKSLPKTDKGELVYESLDLSDYLINKGNGRQGLFLIDIKQWSKDDDDQSSRSIDDSRLILITDLGIIAKKSNSRNYDIFVQSIESGQPVADAKVSVIGRNGIAILSSQTDENGHVFFKDFSKYDHEKTPILFLVEKEGDLSFLPISRIYDRELEFSRFNVGGEYNSMDPKKLTGYLFSDRGLYRPGDTVHLGTIVRANDWTHSPAGIPMEIEIYDARGKLYENSIIPIDKTGFNEYSFTTKESSPTGEWSIDLYIPSDNHSRRIYIGSTDINIKEFEPDRMKVALTLSPDMKSGWVKPEELKATVKAETLFGTPAQDRRVASELSFRPMNFYFKAYQGYHFHNNQSDADQSFDLQLEDTTTDLDGKAELSLRLEETEDASYHLTIITEVFEAGSGRSVAATTQTLVSPHDYLIGAKADGDLAYIHQNSERHLNFIAINPKLQKIALDNLKIARYERKYLSVLTKQDSGVYKYQSKLKRILIDETPFSISEDGEDYALNSAESGDYELVISNDKNEIIYQTYYNIAGTGNVSRSLERNAELQVKLSQKEYKPGDEIELSINAPYVGSGLITIERDKVYTWKWFKTDTTSSTQTITIPKEMEGNGYVNIQFVRDTNSDEIFTSPLSYSVVPFSLSLDKKRANMLVISDKIVKPGQDLSMIVSTDRPQKVVVFAIDEGILQVARYTLQDPLKYFFRKRRLAVDSLQILDLILPEFSKIMALNSATGGDGVEEIDRHLNPFKRKREKPVTYWSGITEVNGNHEFTYSVPDYFNGKLRVMAVAVTADNIDISQDASIVRDDLVLMQNEPYMVAPNDEFEVTLNVVNNIEDLNGEAVSVAVTLETSPELSVIDNVTKIISLAEKREGKVSFKLKATGEPGTAELFYKVSYDNPIKNERSFMQKNGSTSVRPLTPYRVSSVMGRMAGKTETITDIRQLYSPLSQKQASLSHSPLVMMNGVSQYLAHYPYQCSEQLLSKGFFRLIGKDYQAQFGENTYTEQDTTALYNMLRSRQNSAGAIGTWRATYYGNDFITIYAMHYLIEAKERGEAIPSDVYDSLTKYLRKFAGDDDLYTREDLRLRAYAIYLLTRQGTITTNLIASLQQQLENRFGKNWQNDSATMLYLASSYKLLKMDKEAELLIKKPWAELKNAYSDAWWNHNYYDPLVVNSTAIYLISEHFGDKIATLPPQALENMTLMLRKNRNTTLSSALSLLAIDKYASHMTSQATTENVVDLSIFAKAQQNDADRLLSDAKSTILQSSFNPTDDAIIFKNSSKAPAWYSVTEVGFDRNLPEKAISKGLEVSRDYLDDNGKAVSSVKVGDKINVVIRIRSNSEEGLSSIALVDLLPGGFEVVQQNADGSWLTPEAEGYDTYEPEYTDVREDRVIIFGDATMDIQSFTYQIRATNVGEYQIPALFGEAMYDREIQAVSPSNGKIVVKPAE